ncbi:Nuclear pore complex scaffold [Phytophthora infestans]|uniref:Nuclear pore complex scaffold n=1 Tax=Phytophthora infestans TaxID=4787 RepID=A0A833T864_PHYIN|nr:Nuclear pore complex scaffold [Phytophthora infestans]
MSESLSLADAPALRFRQLHQDLLAFAGQSMSDDDAPQYMAELVAAAPELLQPLALAPPSASERAALQANTVNVAGKHVDVSPLIQQEICKLSDEFRASEKTCFEFWLMASEQQQREWVERADQLPPGTIANSVQNAARYFLTSETEYKLHLLKELLRLRLETQLDKQRAQFIVSFTNKLLTEELLTNLVTAFDTQLTQLVQVARMEQSVSYWHTLVADCLVFIVSSTLTLAKEVQKLAELLKTLCGRLKTVVAKVSPHIVNLSSFAQLFEGGSLAGTSPEGAVRQVSCMLQTITAVQVALFVVLLQKSRKMDRETGDMEMGISLCRREHASVVTELHRIFFVEEWEQRGLQSVAMLMWAGFLAGNNNDNSSNSNVSFAEADDATSVVKKAIEERVFHTLVEVQLKYLPDRKRDLRLYNIYERNFELLFRTYSSKMMIDVPTVADKAAIAAMQSENDGEVAAWTGDCLENVIDFATALCARNAAFCCSFWRGTNEELDFHDSNGSGTGNNAGDEPEPLSSSVDDGNCHDFLLACRDAAFKNPGCIASYLRLVAAAGSGPECAQQAFHHIKKNPQQLGWDQFFAVMAKYQRLLTEAEKPTGYSPLGVAQGVGIDGSTFGSVSSAANPGPRFIRPKELEALETIQKLIQEVISDPQLALIFFHNHDWSPIPTFVAFLQCRIPSSLKGSIMKTLAAFARVPDIAPFVWRQVDALQILRTTGDTSVYGTQDISYELEHYESLSRTYPATRGFVTLLYELFENPHAWKSFEGDGRVAAIQFYFEFLLEHVILKFDLRKYEREEEKWALVNGALAIFKKILRNVDTSTTEGSLSYQLLARFLSSNSLLNKVLSILSGDGGVENLESTSTDMHLEHAFFYCLDIVKRETEAKHGSLNFVIDVSKKPSDTYLTKTTAVAALRERCVQHALEIVVLVLEKDVQFVNIDLNRQLSLRLQVEMMHTILCRHRADFVNIVKYIKYSKSTHIPHLSAVILRMISARMSGTDLVDLLIDSGSSADIMIGYMNRLLNVYDDDENDQDENETGTGTEDELHSSGRRKHQDTRTLSSPFELFTQETPPPSIRAAILDLLLENLNKPAPNLAHLLLGNVNQYGDSKAGPVPTSYMKTGLAALITLVSNADFGLETPNLAERCYHVLHSLITQEFSSPNTIAALESVPNDYFASQIQLFSRVYHVTRRKTAAATIAELNMRGWFFKTLAVYLHVGLHKEPPHMKKINKLMGQLLSVSTGSRNDRVIARQEQMLLLQLLDECSFHISPPPVPANQQVVALAEQVTAAVEQGCYYKWLRIDVERFCQALQTLDLTATEDGMGDYYSSSSKRFRVNGDGTSSTSSQNSTEAAAERFIQWAVQWNIYSERISAESHALNSLRELMEVIVLDYLALSREQEGLETPAMWQGLDAVASAEVRQELMSGIVSAVLSKLIEKTSASAQLFEIVSRIALMLFSQLSYNNDGSQPHALPESRQRQNMGFLELLFRSIYSSAAATGNPSAARNSRTLLYSCTVQVLHVLPSRAAQDSAAKFGLASSILSQEQRVRHLLTNQVVDLVCRDASDGEDTLSMALAVSALESLIAFDDQSSLVAIFRERGYLLHFIDIFKKLSEMDAAAFERSNGDASMVKSSVIPEGMDATTIGTMYECFLSLFARVAETQEGAVALLEGGLVRVLSDARNLPTHRPQYLAPHNGTPSSEASVAAFQRVETVYYRKWAPVARLLSACCASLPKNRALTSQVLYFVNKNRKLFTSALKLCAGGQQSQPTSVNLLRELSYVTFVFRYVTQFPDLCEQTLATAKWEKISQLILQVFLFYSAELAPPSDEADGMSDSGSSWWNNKITDSVEEQRNAAIQRFSCVDYEEKILDKCDAAAVKASGSAGLLHMSMLDEEKLYASRMILCNAVAFCASRMMLAVGDGNAGRAAPLLAITNKTQVQNRNQFPSMSSVDPRAFAAATDPLWTLAPSLNDFTARFDSTVFALETSKQLVDALAAFKTEAASARATSVSSASSQQRSLRRREPQYDTTTLENVLEYHADSLAFVVENMLVVLLLHFVHYLSHPEAASSKSTVHQALGKVLGVVSDIESNSFAHAIARRLRELASNS